MIKVQNNNSIESKTIETGLLMYVEIKGSNCRGAFTITDSSLLVSAYFQPTHSRGHKVEQCKCSQ